jgi:trehalose 6-phosphate phosphatase
VPGDPRLERLRAIHRRAGIFLDFDGTLSEIVPRPDLARPAEGVTSVLSSLGARYGLVAVVSGRPGPELRELLGTTAPTVFGLYGLDEGADVAALRESLPSVQALADSVAGAWVEDKGASLAVHYRAASDSAGAARELAGPAEELARRHGLRVIPGKMVLELTPGAVPGKGHVVLREVRQRGLAGCLYAGDDRADLAAFAALDALRKEGLATVKLAVRSEETPEELLEAADLAVERPRGLVDLLRQL